LSNIRETDAIAEVVRIFEDDDIIHVANKVDPLFDIEIINMELITADLDTVSKRMINLGKEVKAGKKEAMIEMKLLERLKPALAAGKLASTVMADEFEAPFLKHLHLLTSKPMLYVLNKKSGGKNLDEMKGADGGPEPRFAKLMDFIKMSGAGYVIVDAGFEHDLKDMTDAEKVEMRTGMGADNGIDLLIKKSYELLGLITYFTTGVEETRGWTIKRGWTAPLAGTAIHNDFKDKFVRAQVIEWNKLLEAGSYAAAREKGWVRTEGKEYVVKDGDVIEFMI
jgi:GTP-binding protein YchF